MRLKSTNHKQKSGRKSALRTLECYLEIKSFPSINVEYDRDKYKIWKPWEQKQINFFIRRFKRNLRVFVLWGINLGDRGLAPSLRVLWLSRCILFCKCLYRIFKVRNYRGSSGLSIKRMITIEDHNRLTERPNEGLGNVNQRIYLTSGLLLVESCRYTETTTCEHIQVPKKRN